MRAVSLSWISWPLLALFVVCSPLLAISPSEAKQTLENKAIAAWKAYEQFAPSLQGTMHQVTHYIDRKDYIATFHYRQNPEGCLIIHHVHENPYENIQLANPSYSAALRRNVTDPASVVLKDFQLAAQTPLRSSPGTMLRASEFQNISPHFSYADTPLSTLVSQPSFTIREIAMDGPDEQALLRLRFRYVLDQQGQRTEKDGTMYLDPNRSWCLRQVKDSEKIFRAGALYRVMEWNWQYEVMDHSAGFPIIKRLVATYDGRYLKDNRESRGEIRLDYQLEVDDRVKTSEFTLSAFGLPEPMGVEPIPPSRNWMWILAAAIGAAALAMLFAWLKRRRLMATRASPVTASPRRVS